MSSLPAAAPVVAAGLTLHRSGAGPGMVALLTSMTALGSLAISIYVPSLPAIGAAFQASPAAVKLTLTVFLITFALTQLIDGPLSDRYGRRPVVLGGLALYVAGSLACAVATSLPMLLAARIVQALGASAGPALGRAIVRDLVEPDRLAAVLATMGTALALSPVLGPTLGGLLERGLGWRANFAFLAVFGAVVWTISWWRLPETHPTHDVAALHPRELWRHYADLLADRDYLSFLLSGGFLTAAMFAWTAGGPFLFIEHFGVQPDRYGLIALVVGLGLVAGTAAIRSLKTWSGKTLIIRGTTVSVIGGSVLLGSASLLPTQPALLIFGMCLVSFGFGMSSPASTAGALNQHPGSGASASALLGSAQIAVGACGTAAASALALSSATPLAWVVLNAAVLAFVMAWMTPKER